MNIEQTCEVSGTPDTKISAALKPRSAQCPMTLGSRPAALKFKILLAPLVKKVHSHPSSIAGWSSLVARQAHNLKVVGSNPTPATTLT